MRLTRRRMEFLAKIKQLYDKTNLPVHYSQVAELLGVSKWSAYEMLKKLEKGGFLASEYAVNQEEKFPGRSMVLFSPTRMVDKLFSGKGDGKGEGRRPSFKEWRQVRDRLLSLLSEELRNTGHKRIIDQLLVEMPDIERPLVFGAYIIALLTAYLQNLSEKSVRLVKSMVLGTTRAEMGLMMFAGTVMGSILESADRFSLADRLAGHITRFQTCLVGVSQQEKALLMEFLEEALEKGV